MPDKETGLALEKITVPTNAAWSRLPIYMSIKFNTEYASQITNCYNAHSLVVRYSAIPSMYMYVITICTFETIVLDFID